MEASLPETSLPYDEETEKVKTFIITTIAEFVDTGDSVGGMLFSLLKRMMKTISGEDIRQVAREMAKFVDGLRERGYLEDAAANDGHASDEVQGHRTTDRADSIG